ncbi:MAG TPA: ABC-three component system protein [Polyangiaceae bacterium]
MDGVARQFYEQCFKIDFLEKKGDEFQYFFSSVMEKAYPADFIRVRPWGNVGDRKNDGYLKSKRMLFQVYAPNEMSAVACVSKIDEDFNGALPHWNQFFSHWTFVHNSMRGLGPEVTAKLLELGAAHANVTVLPWGFEELRREAMNLDESELASLFGPAPTRQGMIELGLADLAPVLDHITRLPAIGEPDLRPVPADKLQRNLLSDSVAGLLRAGMSRADLVRKYFKLKPTLQDQIAEAFRAQYAAVRATAASPDEIFATLQRCTGGDSISSPSRQNAVLATLAFFFEECDIFERPEHVEVEA